MDPTLARIRFHLWGHLGLPGPRPAAYLWVLSKEHVEGHAQNGPNGPKHHSMVEDFISLIVPDPGEVPVHWHEGG